MFQRPHLIDHPRQRILIIMFQVDFQRLNGLMTCNQTHGTKINS